MVVTRLPATRDSGATQERMARPSRWTVQAPQRAMPQPNFVPVRPRESRMTHKSGVEGSSSTETGLPFNVKEVMKRLRGMSADDLADLPGQDSGRSAKDFYWSATTGGRIHRKSRRGEQNWFLKSIQRLRESEGNVAAPPTSKRDS